MAHGERFPPGLILFRIVSVVTSGGNLDTVAGRGSLQMPVALRSEDRQLLDPDELAGPGTGVFAGQ